MTWTMPFVQSMLGLTIFAPLTVSAPPAAPKVTDLRAPPGSL
jgi:hypothetical protein